MQPTYEQFLEACRTGDLATVERALAVLSEDIIISNDNFAFRQAAERGNLDVVNRLLEIPAVRENATANNNAAFCQAVKKCRELQLLSNHFPDPDELDAYFKIATRLRQEKNVADYLKQHQQSFINEPQEVYNDYGTLYMMPLDTIFEKIEDRHMARIFATLSLSENLGNPYITNHILALAYHDALCGKSVCTKPAQTQEEGLITCPVINQFRDYALGAKERAQAKLGTQATTSTNSSTEPSKKARTS